MTTRIAPSSAIEAAMSELPVETTEVGDAGRLAEIGRLGARLVLRRT